MGYTVIRTKAGEFPYIGREYKCMNCRRIITEPKGDLYSRRFCSPKCMEEYISLH